MPAERLPMRQVREVLRLTHAAGLSERQIAAALRISRSTVAEYLRRAAVIGITWLAPAELERWRKLLQAATDEWIAKAEKKGLDGRKLLEDLQATIKAGTS